MLITRNIQTESEGMEIFHENGTQNKVEVATLISDNINFKSEAVRRDKQCDYIIIQMLIQSEF
jgi:hypothetical protein